MQASWHPLLFVLLTASSVIGQSPVDDEVRVNVAGSPLRRYEPNAWGVVTINAVNNTDNDANSVVSVHINDDERTQFARRFWIPARAQRTVWLPLNVGDLNRWDEQFAANYRHLIGGGSQERIQQRTGNTFQASAMLVLDDARVKTATIFNRANVAYDDHPDYDAYETVGLARFEQDESRQLFELDDDFLPPFSAAFDAMDQIVIGSDRIQEDSAGITNLRHWLAGGGRMWIMLDRVSRETVTALLGDTVTYEEVDRVPLTEFTFENFYEQDNPVEEWRALEPVDFLRVLTDATDVHCWIDGWPAAFWLPYGRGEVLLTTLDARGWRFHYDAYAKPRGDGMPTEGITNSLRSVTQRFYSPRASRLMEVADVRQDLKDQIGYAVPTRKVAGTILSLNCLLLLVVGICLTKLRRLDHLAWLFPAITVGAAIVFLILGITTKARVAPTVVQWQLVEVTPGTNEAHVTELAAVYTPEETALSLGTPSIGLTTPDLSDLAGATQRNTWLDDGRGAWDQLQVAPGTVRFAEHHSVVQMDRRVRVAGRFTSAGFEGRVEGISLQRGNADAVITLPPARPTSLAWTSDDGDFVCGPEQQLDAGQYIQATMVSDEQRRRRDLYDRLLDYSDDMQFPQQPSLFFWRKPLATGVEFPPELLPGGNALVAMPIEFQSTPSGESFTVPASFIRISSGRGEQGISAAYNQSTGQWTTDATDPTDAPLAFHLPAGVLPCQLTSATLRIKVHAPSRTLTVTTADEARAVVARHDNASGVYNVDITNADLLQLADDGALPLILSVSESRFSPQGLRPGAGVDNAGRKFNKGRWQIDYVLLEVSGTKL